MYNEPENVMRYLYHSARAQGQLEDVLHESEKSLAEDEDEEEEEEEESRPPAQLPRARGLPSMTMKGQVNARLERS
jgi:hypothetical protein